MLMESRKVSSKEINLRSLVFGSSKCVNKG